MTGYIHSLISNYNDCHVFMFYVKCMLFDYIIRVIVHLKTRKTLFHLERLFRVNTLHFPAGNKNTFAP